MSRTKIVIVKGSPRESGNSAILAEKLAEGAREAGAKVESYYLHGMEINACDACDTCQSNPGMGCIIEDDMQVLYATLWDADALVIASPIYWFHVSAQTKLFMDRCYGLIDANGWAFKGKKVGILLTYGDSDPFNSGAVNALRTFQDGFGYVGAEIAGMVYGSASDAGEIRSATEVLAKAYELGKQLASQ